VKLLLSVALAAITHTYTNITVTVQSICVMNFKEHLSGYCIGPIDHVTVCYLGDLRNCLLTGYIVEN
jgi:hypothetical protein